MHGAHDRRTRVRRAEKTAAAESRDAETPSTDSVGDVARIQAQAGNAAVVQLLAQVGPADDPLEREADAVAAKIAPRLGRGAVAGATARAPADDVPAHEQSGHPHAPTDVQRVSSVPSRGGMAAPAGFDAAIATAGGGRRLPEDVRAPMESHLGADLSGVQLHTGPEAAELARSVGARAFTTGTDVFFDAGEYAPGTDEGRHVLAHELTHVVQQGGGGSGPTTVQRMSDADRDAIFARAAKLDYDLLTEVAAKMALLKAVNAAAKGGWGDEGIQFKQQLLVSALPMSKLQALVADATATGQLGPARAKLLKGKTRSSSEVYKMLDDCRSLLTDYYRSEADGEQASQAWGGALVSAASAFDRSGDDRLADDLTHTTTKKGLFGKKTKEVDHSLQDVIAKVKTVSEADVGVTSSPLSLPRTDETLASAPLRARVGIVGAGPVGLMAALEARMQGADVVLFEARGDEYSRRQVLALDKSTEHKLAKFGVKFDLLESEKSGVGNTVAVKYIEKALRQRTRQLGIEERVGWSLVGATRGDDDAQTTAKFQIGRGKDATQATEQLDLLVVAAGAGVAKANRYTGACIGDELGITYDVQEAKDYAVVGLFEPTTVGSTADKDDGSWAYRFNTPKVTYVLRQIPAELMAEFSGEGGKAKLEAFVRDRATQHFKMGDNATLAKAENSLGQATPATGVFPIEIQRARTFVNEHLSALVIGDSAATPHPKSGSGFNSGVRELDALADVVATVQSQVVAATDPDTGERREPDEESASAVASALSDYNAEMKRVTDVMMAKGLKVLAEQHGRYLLAAIAGLDKEAGNLLAADYATGAKVEGIRRVAEAALAKDSTWSSEDKLDLLVQAQKDIASIRKEMAARKAAALSAT